MHRYHLGVVALGVLALAACTESQSPNESPATPASPSLPVLETMRLEAPVANATAGYTITLRFINPPTDDQRRFFETAAAKWQSILVGDVPDASGVIPARSCGSGIPTPVFNGVVDDALIDVLLQPIDGPGAVLGPRDPVSLEARIC